MPRNGLLLGGRKFSRPNVLKDVTIRDFSGAWNVIDNDLNLSSKFSKKLENMQRATDGGNEVRSGTELFAETSEFLDEIINCEYFSANVICVGLNGKVVRVDSLGNVFLIWDDEVASKLPGSPKGWSATVFASFAVFNGELIIANGVNKPLVVPNTLLVNFLRDLANGSNVFTPIARYVLTHGRYLLMAGDPNAVDRLFISSTDVGGVWVGDDAPNDAVNIDLGSRVPQGSEAIKGIGRFRDKIVVAFEEALLPGTLGVFTGSDHTPTFDDAIEAHGSISHRVIKTIGKDMFFVDPVGVNSVRRAIFTGNVTPDRPSRLVDPEIQKSISTLKTVAALEDRTWSVYDSLTGNYMLFVPNGDTNTTITETRAFVFKSIEALKIAAWQDWRGWNFTSGCRSALKRIFLTTGTQVFIMGNANNVISADFVKDQETFSDGTVFTDGKGFTPVASDVGSGVPIDWVWELPWADNGQRFLKKSSRYINFDTLGDERFTAEMYVDNIFKDRSDPGELFTDSTLFDDDTGWDVEALDPALSMEFAGGESPGFGRDEFGRAFGGGRPTRDERGYAWTADYKLYKLRMRGSALKPLKFVSITLAYQPGSPRR